MGTCGSKLAQENQVGSKEEPIKVELAAESEPTNDGVENEAPLEPSAPPSAPPAAAAEDEIPIEVVEDVETAETDPLAPEGRGEEEAEGVAEKVAEEVAEEVAEGRAEEVAEEVAEEEAEGGTKEGVEGGTKEGVEGGTVPSDTGEK